MPYLDKEHRPCGFVDYEEKENTNQFSRRYFMIDKRAFLGYMDNPLNLPENTEPIAEIKLAIISHARDAAKQRLKVQYCFVVSTHERNYYFKADSQEEKDDWIIKINNASKITVPASRGHKSPCHQNQQDCKSEDLTKAYRTEVIAGVVVKTPVNAPPTQPSHHLESSDSEDEGRRPDSFPTASPTRQINKASTLPSAHSDNILMEGWGVKQGGVRKNWKRRYFVLRPDGVSYYKAEGEKIPIKTIEMKDIISCKISGQWSSLQRDNLFEINCIARTFFVQTYSPEDMESWVSKISGVVADQKARTPSANYNVSSNTVFTFNSVESTYL